MRHAVALLFAIALAANPQMGYKSPLLLYKVEPEYTSEALQARLEGNVLLRAVIGLDGKADKIRVIKPLGRGLDDKAIACVRRWRFRPAIKANGKPEAVWENITVEFRLTDSK